jgi:hypothetical protein
MSHGSVLILAVSFYNMLNRPPKCTCRAVWHNSFEITLAIGFGYNRVVKFDQPPTTSAGLKHMCEGPFYFIASYLLKLSAHRGNLDP